MQTVIETRELTKTYGRVVAVDRLSLAVPAGGVFGLLGPNGSGKTTTISMLLGLVRPTAGSLSLFGEEVSQGRQSAALRRVGAIVEMPAFYPQLSARGNLRYFQGISHRGDRDQIERLLDLVGLAERAESAYETFSLGMKQRLAIALALLGDPELVMLDEPTNGLDPAGVAEVRDLIRRLGAEGHTIILSSHQLSEVEQVCQRVAILARGRLIVEGSVDELLRRRDSIRLRTTDDGLAHRTLVALDWVGGVRAEDGSLIVDAPTERAADLSRLLADAGVFIREMSPHQFSLESFFLEVTGEEPVEREPVEAGG